jgi:hypothetical protein
LIIWKSIHNSDHPSVKFIADCARDHSHCKVKKRKIARIHLIATTSGSLE